MKITRAFTRKINLSKYGGNTYETADFYCSREEEGLPGGMATSEELHNQCKEDVMDSIKTYVKEIQEKKAEETSPELNVETPPFGK